MTQSYIEIVGEHGKQAMVEMYRRGGVKSEFWIAKGAAVELLKTVEDIRNCEFALGRDEG